MLLALAQNGARFVVVEGTIMFGALLPCREASTEPAEAPVLVPEEMIVLPRFVQSS